jgi:hypothetical protein
MAFDLAENVIGLDFEGTELDGLEVSMRAASIDALLDLAVLAESLEGLQSGVSPAELKKTMRGVLQPFAAVLVGWNLTRGGEPVPATVDGLLQLSPGMLNRVLNAYIAAVTAQGNVDPKQPGDSSSGETSDPPMSIPMKPLS